MRRHERRHVVIAEPAPDDQDALASQRRECFAEVEVEAGVEIGSQRDLHDGNVCIGVHQQQGHEHAVVETSLIFESMGDPGFGQHFADSSAQRG